MLLDYVNIGAGLKEKRATWIMNLLVLMFLSFLSGAVSDMMNEVLQILLVIP